MNGSIRIHRVRRAIRLLGEFREVGPGTEAARQGLLDGLIFELGAVVAGVVRDEQFRLGGRNGCVQATLGGFDGTTIEVYRAHDIQGSDFNPCLRAVMERRAGGDGTPVVTTTHQELVPSRTWERSVWVNEYVRPAKVAHFMGSLRYCGPARVQGFGFMRAAGDRPFDEEDRSLLHLVNLECNELFAEAPAHLASGTGRQEREADLPRHLRLARVRLAPRVRETLDCLLLGAADKEIAAQLGLSFHTVRQYVRVIYKAFGVSSRAQLFARRFEASR